MYHRNERNRDMSVQSNALSGNGAATDFGAIVIGAGFGGLRMLYELRERGISAKAIEAGSDVGGTWYWNRYPGARTDSEAWIYCFPFSKELLDEWNWTERFPAQPEVLNYLRHFADKFDLRKDIQFNSRVQSATYNASAKKWTVTAGHGEVFTCTYLIAASGVLSLPVDPPFEGLDSFECEWYLTARWPKAEINFADKRVGIIGTGATGVQVIPVVAEKAKHLTVFQRTPNYVIPANNRPLDDAERKAYKERYDAIWEKAQNHVFGFAMDPANRTRPDVTPEEQQEVFEAVWRIGGFQFLFETFDDLLVDEESNEAAAEFLRNKIREIVKDPVTAELLCPKGYPLGGKRPPLGHSYYEAFNRDNVELVDVSTNPIRRITPKGVRTETDEYEFDMLIFATGFDAGTGALRTMDIHGRAGQSLTDRWASGPETYLGITVDGFPNLFMISGPQTPFANIPIVIENAVQWIGRAITGIEDGDLDYVEPTPVAVDSWVKEVDDLVDATLLRRGEKVHSWFLGANVPGKPHVVLFYFGGANNYFNRIHGVADGGYEGFVGSAR